MTLEDDIELLILKSRKATYTDIVRRLKSSDEYVTQALKNLLSDGKIFRLKNGAFVAFA